jgi:chromosome segregation ATPase
MGIFFKSKVDIDQLLEENDQLKNKLHEILDRHNSLRELESKIEKVKKEISDRLRLEGNLKKDTQKLSSEKSKLLEEVKLLKNEYEKNTKINRALNDDINDKNNRLQKFEINITDDKKEMGRLENKIVEAETVIKKLKETEIKLNKNIDEQNRAISELEQKENQQKIKNDSIRGDVKDHEKNLAQIKNEIDDRNIKLVKTKQLESNKNKDLKILNEKVAQLETIKSKLEIVISKLSNQLSEKDKLNIESSEKLELMHNNISNNQKELAVVEEKIARDNNKYEELLNIINNLENEKSNLEKDLNKKNMFKSNLENEISKLREIEKEINEKITDHGRIKSDLEKGNEELTIRQAKILDNLNRDLSQLAENRDYLKSEIEKKEKELKEKQKILFGKTVDVAEYIGKLNVLKKQQSSFEMNLKETNKSIADLNETFNILKKRESDQRKYLKELRTESGIIELKKAEFEKELQQLHERISKTYLEAEKDKQRILEEIQIEENKLENLHFSIGKEKDILKSLNKEKVEYQVELEKLKSKISKVKVEKNLILHSENSNKPVSKRSKK